MAFTLTAATAVISLTLAGILGLWSLGLDVKPKDGKRRYHRIARLCAFIIAILLLVLIWHVAKHQVFPQWLTGVGSGPSIGDVTPQDVDPSVGIIMIFLIPLGVFAITTVLVGVVLRTLVHIDSVWADYGDDDADSKPNIINSDSIFAAQITIFMFIVLFVCVLVRPHKQVSANDVFGGKLGFDYHQIITTNYVTDEKVLYENDKNIALEANPIGTKPGESWLDVSSITALNQLPREYDNRYRVSKGYDHLRIGDIWFTELHNVSGDIPEGLEDKAVIKITKVTLVSENVSFRDGTNTDIVRSTGDIKRVHIEYEVTNIDELRATVQNKEDLKQLIGGE